MKLIIILYLILILSSQANALENNIFYDRELEMAYQDKLFQVSSTENSMLKYTLLDEGANSIPFYPVIKIDFFRIFNTNTYKDKAFTYVIKEVPTMYDSVLGIRFRLSVGSSNK